MIMLRLNNIHTFMFAAMSMPSICAKEASLTLSLEIYIYIYIYNHSMGDRNIQQILNNKIG